MTQQRGDLAEYDPEVRALMLVIVRTLRYVIRWLERRYHLN